MFTHKDIEMRTIFVVNCIEHDRSLRVNSGELMLEEIEGDKKRTLTKFPFLLPLHPGIKLGYLVNGC